MAHSAIQAGACLKNHSRNPCRKSFSSTLRSIRWRTVNVHGSQMF